MKTVALPRKPVSAKSKVTKPVAKATKPKKSSKKLVEIVALSPASATFEDAVAIEELSDIEACCAPEAAPPTTKKPTKPRKTGARKASKSAVDSKLNASDMVDLNGLADAPVQQAAKAVSKLHRTFTLDTLEQSFLAYAQLTSQPPDQAPLALRVKRLKALDADFINNPEFVSEGAEAKFLGDNLLYGVLHGKGNASSLADLPPHLARLCETKLLTPEEEQLLFQRLNYLRFRVSEMLNKLDKETATEWEVERINALLRAVQWHRDCIVKANMRLVISIVKKFVNAKNAFDDLLSDGIVALMRAVDKFDFDRGFRFSTYATQVVRRNAYRQVVTSQQERLKVTNSVHEGGIDVSDEDRQPTMSEDRWYALRTKLGLMLDNLDRREKLIVRARFSLGSHRRVQTLQGLADRLGVSKERVRQLEKRALDKLRVMADDFQFQELEAD